MQYLLTEEEYIKLTRSQIEIERGVHQKNEKLVFLLCQRICNHEPVLGWHNDIKGTPTPWECIYNGDNEGWYCDKCPVQNECPADKCYSK